MRRENQPLQSWEYVKKKFFLYIKSMTSAELFSMAQFAQYPVLNRYYNDSYEGKVDKSIARLPIIADDDMALYTKMLYNNAHHYTMYYHINYALPFFDEILNFGFSLKDFELKEWKTEYGDLSYLYPLGGRFFDVSCFTDGRQNIYPYNVLKPVNPYHISYRDFYLYNHKCSRLKNLGENNGRKLFVSADSQFIADILPVACYFDELWYFDNRTGMSEDWNYIDKEKTVSYAKEYADTEFTDCLIVLANNPLEWYTEINFM